MEIRYYGMQKTTGEYRHVLQSVSLLGSVQVVSIFLGLVRNKCIAVLLGPTGMGLLSLYNGVIKFFADTTTMGVPVSGVRKLTAEENVLTDMHRHRMAEHVAVIRCWSLLAAVVGMLVCMASAPWVAAVVFEGNHCADLLLLSICVGLTAVSGGEMAILKGFRRLHSLAKVSVWQALWVLLLTTPIIYIYRERAIVASLLLASLLQCLLAFRHSLPLCPWTFPLRFSYLRQGVGMVRLGMGLVLAGIMGSGMELLLRSFLGEGSLQDLGYYNAGYMLTVTYGSMVFAALEYDFFPRLSATCACSKRPRINACVSRQVEMSLLFIAPMVAVLLACLPLLLPLLFSGRFMPVVGMLQFSLPSLLFRSVSLPTAYLTLAKDDARSYLLTEMVYDIGMLGLLWGGYRLGGVTGMGVFFLVVSAFYALFLQGYMFHKYRFVLSSYAIRIFSVHFTLLLIELGVVRLMDGWMYVVGCAGLVTANVMFTWRQLQRMGFGQQTKGQKE